ncbi:MAG: TIGR03118 family protein [Alphaproteobacteria bacterium]|nr:TIGR03118 family protein [Alphaproteobacteria bacterium]
MKISLSVVAALAMLSSSALAGAHQHAVPSVKVVPLIADKEGKAPNTDPLLKNPWGISQFPGGNLWVSDNRTGVSTIYDPTTGAKQDLVVKIPKGEPTGQVAIPSGNGFVVSKNGKSGEALFIFASNQGTVTGWNPGVDVTNAVIGYSASTGHAPKHGGDDGPYFTGIAYDPVTNHLFVTDFTNNAVIVLDNTFAKIGSFTDPNIPAGYAPFNAAVLNGKLYVTYGKKNGDDAKEGPGLGYVDVFTTAGVLEKRLISNGVLNAPWGLAIAPSTFGDYAGKLLVGNFGEGRINVFDPDSGALLGTLKGPNGRSIELEHLWQLDDTGNGSITFSAGMKRERHGLVGWIQPQ